MNGLDAYMNLTGTTDSGLGALSRLVALALAGAGSGYSGAPRRGTPQSTSALENAFGPQRTISDIGLSDEEFLRRRRAQTGQTGSMGQGGQGFDIGTLIGLLGLMRGFGGSPAGGNVPLVSRGGFG